MGASQLSISSVVSGQGIAHMGFLGCVPTISCTLEYRLTKWIEVRFGGMELMLLGGTSDESGSDIGVLPFVGLNIRL